MFFPYLYLLACDNSSRDTFGVSSKPTNSSSNSSSSNSNTGSNDDTGQILSDVDGDGQTIEEGDCDDGNPEVYLGAEEVYYDGIDSNCD